MATKAQLLDIATLIQISMDNNWNALISELNRNGYMFTVSTPQATIMKFLIDLYKQAPDRVYAILRNVPYNAAANNYTTSDAFKAKALQYTSTEGNSTAKGLSDWWGKIFTPATTTIITNPTVVTGPGPSSSSRAIAITFLGVALLVFAWALFK